MNSHTTNKKIEKELKIKKSQLRKVKKRLTLHFRQLSELKEDLVDCKNEKEQLFFKNEIEKTNNLIVSYQNELHWIETDIKNLKREGL